MRKKLLNRTTNNFLIFSVLVLLISAPIFYYITDMLYIKETDETLQLHKKEFVNDFLPTLKITDLSTWNKYNRNVSIVESRGIMNDTLFNKTYYDKLENENEPYREINAPLVIEGKKYTYVGRINLIEKKDMVISTALLFLLLISLLLAGMLLITKISSKRIWKPFYHTLDQIYGFEIDKNKKLDFGSTDIEEFDRLNKSLERLIEKNTNIYNDQKEFVENAAHELQTPLTLFQTKLDTLSQMEMTSEQSVIVSSLNTDVSRLNRLNKNLLLLSKIDNVQYIEKQRVIVNDAIEKHLDFFREQAKSKKISIITELNHTIMVMANPALIEVLVNNLFLNAISHNISNGRIVVSATENTLTFLNTGAKEPLPIERLFNRFSKLHPSSQGNGLGLTIIKKIAELNNWEISYTYNDLHCFKVKF